MLLSHYVISLNYSLFNILYNKHDANLIDILNDIEYCYINKYFANRIIPFYYIECYSIIKNIYPQLLYLFKKEKKKSLNLYHVMLNNELMNMILNVDELQLYNLLHNSKNKEAITEYSTKTYKEILLEMEKHFIYDYNYNEMKIKELKQTGLYYDNYHIICENAIYKMKKGNKKYNRIKLLNYYNAELGDNGIEYICDSIKNYCNVKILCLSWNNISDIGFTYLCNNLKEIPFLERLNWFSNCITDNGVKSLCDNLQYISKLILLDLGANQITDTGASVLTDNIYKLPYLQRCFLYYNNLYHSVYIKWKIWFKHPNKRIIVDSRTIDEFNLYNYLHQID